MKQVGKGNTTRVLQGKRAIMREYPISSREVEEEVFRRHMEASANHRDNVAFHSPLKALMLIFCLNGPL